MAEIAWTELKVPERKRTYIFPGSVQLVLENVTHIEVRPSGKHLFQCADGRKRFVNSGWLWIELDIEEWQF